MKKNSMLKITAISVIMMGMTSIVADKKKLQKEIKQK